jgi:hypothetical protein
MTGLHERKSLFGERNLFVYALLGVIARGRRIRDFVAVQLSGGDASPSVPSPTRREVVPVPDAVYAVLGVVSFIGTIETLLQVWSAEADALRPVAPPREHHPAKPGTLLR